MALIGTVKVCLVLIISRIAYCSLNWDPACGITKGCFPDCRSQDCTYMVTWKDAGTGLNALQFTIQLEHKTVPGYLAIGFSKDYRMGDDSVVGCVPATGKCYSSYNTGTHNSALSPITKGITSYSVAVQNGVISCNFTRAYSLSIPDTQFFDIKHNKYILMFVHGSTELKKGLLAIDSHHMIPFSSDGMVDFTSNIIVSERQLNTPVVKLHGIVMTSAWLFLSSIGIVTARYNRQLLKRYRLFGTQIWFQIHRVTMVAVVCLTIAGFVSIFVEIGGYSQLNPPARLSATSAHPVLGIIVTSLSILNVIGGLLRPGVDHGKRWLFNWIHFCMGIFTQILAVATLLIGYRMQRASLPMSVLYIGVVHIVVTGLIFSLIEVHRWRTKKEPGSAVDILSDPFVLNFRKTASEVYGYLLLGYVVTTLLLTLAILGLITTS